MKAGPPGRDASCQSDIGPGRSPGVRGLSPSFPVALCLVVLLLSSLSLPLSHPNPVADSRATSTPASADPSPAPAAPPNAPVNPAFSAFAARVHHTVSAVAADGGRVGRIQLPYLAAPAEVVGGAVVPGVAVRAAETSATSSSFAAPNGVAYYGESDPSSGFKLTVAHASSVAGSFSVSELKSLYFGVDTPDMWGAQLNTVLTGVTLQGSPGNEFWVQNVVDYIQSNQTLDLGDATWNFSSPGAAIPAGASTIASHDPNGSIVGGAFGLYVGMGPYLRAPLPFTCTLYVNSSVTVSGDQELWFNYSLLAGGRFLGHGNYDWVRFNSTNPAHPGSVGIAPFEANGTGLDPVGLTNDFELDVGIGAYDGATQDVLAANATATLDYCPVIIAVCAPGQMLSVPAALSYGGETGETGYGLSVAYQGTTAELSAGPSVLRGLWGYGGEPGTSPGATPVSNRLAFAGAPAASAVDPYAFVFIRNENFSGQGWAWAPDVPVWDLPPGTYDYTVVLADYGQENGTLTVGSAPTALGTTLLYSPERGVYTPLWSLNNSALSGISSAGNGTVDSPFLLFNNPTRSCLDCDGAPNGSLSSLFFNFNDYLFPTFPGLLLAGTSAFVLVDHPVDFEAGVDLSGSVSALTVTPYYLPLQLYETHHVTLAHDDGPYGWPSTYEVQTVGGWVPAEQNPFPEAVVTVWNSSDDLLMANDFGTSETEVAAGCAGICPSYACVPGGCVPQDELLLYGGTNNTVWDNKFLNATPNGTALAGSFTGLAEAESGDWIYDNDFETGNPTMFMVYDVYNDSCPVSYAAGCLPVYLPTYRDTWNVTPSPAGSVDRTVNGYPLSGNVLGLSCGGQGGNYWWNRGDAYNPIGGTPYTNRFDYSYSGTIFPGGYPAVESSIRSGGDYAPLAGCATAEPWTLNITEVGLPSGTPWKVVINGTLETSSAAWLDVPVASGNYTLSVDSVPGFVASPGVSTVRVSSNVTVRLVFSAPMYVLEFHETGLTAGTEWNVSITPLAAPSTTSWLNVSAPNGTYGYTVSPIPGYLANPASGSVRLAGANRTVNVTFTPFVARFLLSFTVSGLPAGTTWSVTVAGVANRSALPSIDFTVANASYPYTVTAPAGYEATPSHANVTVSGPTDVAVSIARAPPESSPSTTFPWELVGVSAAAILTSGVAALIVLRRRRRAPPVS